MGKYYSSWDIDDAINQINIAKANNVIYNEGIIIFESNLKWMLFSNSSWDESLGMLYAFKSTCIVKHSPVTIISGSLFSLGWDVGLPDGCIIFICGIITIPIDIIQLPIQISIKTIWHLNVSDNDINKALYYLSLSRRYGFKEDIQSNGNMLSPQPYYIDNIGYKLH